MDLTIQKTRILKPRLKLWTDVSHQDMEEIDKMQSIPDLESTLCSLFAVDLPEPKRGVLLELYVQAVLFCRENRFNKEQTSSLLSILKAVHEANVETPLEDTETCFRYFKELLLCHSVRRPPFSINLFDAQEVQRVFEYIQSNYVRHYRLYRHIFTPLVQLDLSLTYSEATEEEPPHDSSLAEVENAPQTDESAGPREEPVPDREGAAPASP